ncbi:MAG: hypothetical protein ACFFD2_10595 [Promethearchaeota archaeon]
MSERNLFLWKGTVSSKYKTIWIFSAIILFSIFVVIELWLSVWYITEGFKEGPLYLFYTLLGIIGFCIFVGFLAILTYILNFFPQYFLVKDKLILKERTFLGRLRTKSFSLMKVNTIFIEKSTGINSFNFFTATVDEILEEYLILEYDSFLNWDFQFKMVDFPDKLLKELKSVIPLKENPNLANLYERIE